jgi:hypothetical protein
MDLDTVKTLTPPLIGAVFVVIGLVWKDRIERRNAAQSWYEQYYITKGVDPLIAHYMSLQTLLEDLNFLLSKPASYSLQSIPQPLSYEVTVRIQILLRSRIFDRFNRWFGYFIQDHFLRHKQHKELSKIEMDHLKTILGTLQDMNGDLVELRRELLKIRISNKSEIYKISEYPEVAKLVKSCDQRIKSTIEKSPFISRGTDSEVD